MTDTITVPLVIFQNKVLAAFALQYALALDIELGLHLVNGVWTGSSLSLSNALMDGCFLTQQYDDAHQNSDQGSGTETHREENGFSAAS